MSDPVTVVLEGGPFDGQEVSMEIWRARVLIKDVSHWPNDYIVYVATRREVRGLMVYELESNRESSDA